MTDDWVTMPKTRAFVTAMDPIACAFVDNTLVREGFIYILYVVCRPPYSGFPHIF